MNDELVKMLREKAKFAMYAGRPDIAADYKRAAEAIEELQMLKALADAKIERLEARMKRQSKENEV